MFSELSFASIRLGQHHSGCPLVPGRHAGARKLYIAHPGKLMPAGVSLEKFWRSHVRLTIYLVHEIIFGSKRGA